MRFHSSGLMYCCFQNCHTCSTDNDVLTGRYVSVIKISPSLIYIFTNWHIFFLFQKTTPGYCELYVRFWKIPLQCVIDYKICSVRFVIKIYCKSTKNKIIEIKHEKETYVTALGRMRETAAEGFGQDGKHTCYIAVSW